MTDVSPYSVFTNTPTKQLTTDPTTESSVLDSTTDESTFSFTPIVVVFILLLIAAVSLYVAYSRRHQVIPSSALLLKIFKNFN